VDWEDRLSGPAAPTSTWDVICFTRTRRYRGAAKDVVDWWSARAFVSPNRSLDQLTPAANPPDSQTEHLANSYWLLDEHVYG